MKKLDRKTKRTRQTSYQLLETRCVLATVSIDLGVMTIVGTQLDDNVRIQRSFDDPSQILVNDSGDIQSFDAAGITQIDFFGLGGDDSFDPTASDSWDLEIVNFFGGSGDDFMSVESFTDQSATLQITAFGGEGDDEFRVEREIPVNTFHEIDFRGGPGSCLLYTSPSPRDRTRSRMPSSA